MAIGKKSLVFHVLSVDVASPKILKKISQTTDGCSFKLKEFGAGVQNIVLFRDILIKKLKKFCFD